MNLSIIIGIMLIILGAAIFVVSQLFLRRWINNYNKEWQGGIDSDEML